MKRLLGCLAGLLCGLLLMLPWDTAAAERVTFAQITLRAPVVGESAAKASVSGSLPYTCTETVWELRTASGAWTVATSPFAAGQVYRARVTLQPNAGNAFAQTATGEFDGFLDVLTEIEPETSSEVNAAGCLILTVQYPALGGTHITSVAVSDWSAPVVGSKPSTKLSAVLFAGSAKVSADGYTASLRWQSGSGNGWSDWSVKNPFENGMHYRAVIEIRPTGSYVFSFDASGSYECAVTVNNTAHTGVQNGNALQVVLDCGVLQAQSISAVAISGLAAPQIGAMPGDDYIIRSTPDGAVTQMATQWQRSRDRTRWADISTTMTVEPGYYYRVHLYLKSQNAQCAFTDQTTATLNGQTVACERILTGAFSGCLHLIGDFGALEAVPMPPGITVQPVDLTAQAEDTVTLHVSATASDGGILEYQWYTGTSPDRASMTAIPGATSPDHVARVESGTRYYYAVVWNRLGSLRSEPQASRVISVSGTARPTVGTPCFTRHPVSVAALLGDPVILAAQVSVNGSGTLRLQWYVADNAVFRNAVAVSGATDAEYAVPQHAGIRYYRLEARAVHGDLVSDPVLSRIAAVTYAAPPATLERIELVTMPTRLRYTVGDVLDCTGLAIRVIRTDGSETRTDGFVCTPMVLHAVGTQQITVSYGGMHAMFEVSVAPMTEPEPSTVDSILPPTVESTDPVDSVPASSRDDAASGSSAERNDANPPQNPAPHAGLIVGICVGVAGIALGLFIFLIWCRKKQNAAEKWQ